MNNKIMVHMVLNFLWHKWDLDNYKKNKENWNLLALSLLPEPSDGAPNSHSTSSTAKDKTE